MAYDDTASMFARMLASAPVLPPSVHRSAWRHARQTDHVDLQKTLIARPDAPTDLIAQYATLGSTDLRGVYLGRDDVRDDQVAAGLVGERRASVLADALDRTNQDPAVLAVAVEAFLAKPTKVLFYRLRHLPSAQTTPELAEALLTCWDKTSLDEHIHIRQMTAAVANLGVRRASDLVTRVNHPDVATALLAHDLDDALVIATLRRILPGLTRGILDKNRANVVYNQVYAMIEHTRRGHPDNPAVADEFTAALRTYRGDAILRLRARITTQPWPGRAQWAAGAGDETRVVVSPDALATPTRVVAVAETPPRELVGLACGTDASTLSEIAGTVPTMTDARVRAEVTIALLRNPKLTLEDRHRLMRTIAETPGAWGSMVTFNAIAFFPEDPIVAAAWCFAFPHATLEAHGWEPFGGRVTASTLVPLWAASELPQAKSAAGLALTLGVGRDVLEQTSAKAVMALWRGKLGHGGEATLATIAEMLADAFGDRADAWTLFHTLKGDFPGTFGELLDTCQAAAT